MHKKHTYRIFLLLPAVLLLCFTAKAQTVVQCDSLIVKGIDAMWKKEYVRSMELLTQARTIAEKNRWYKQEFLAINNIGANYYAMLDYGEALNYYLESYTLAVKKLEPVNEMVVLNNIAILYSREKNHAKAKEYFSKAYEIAKENNDSLKIGLYAINLGNAANESRHLKEARKYIDEALIFTKRDVQLYDLAGGALAENLLLSGNTQAAREKATQVLAVTNNPNFNGLGTTLGMVIAKAYNKEKNYPEAEVAIRHVFKMNPALDIKKDLYGLMSNVYAGKGDYSNALIYKDSVVWAEEELNRAKNGELYQTNSVKFELQDYQNQLAINAEKLKSERKLFYYIIAVAAALLAIIILVMRNISVRNKQRQLLAERNEKELALELEKEKNEKLLLAREIAEKEAASLLEQERLKNEIEVRNRKLSARALYLSGRNELIEEVITSLSQNTAVADNASLTQQLRSLKGHLKNNDEWDSFITHFEEVNHGLLEKLKAKHPSITANDLRFIAYIYMNLSTKEIATLLNITPEACRKRKERLASKMELPNNTSLYDYLSFVS